ncbi:RecX family transcriptional regulator [Tepidibacillus infernus]|uniref:Regulatory protein RecX n=1 Tax=Tepidibacillus decaturensis TaxID=1413211 RepID=A0A135L3L1_9BACI|nr:RecX family transcriptional regulator [Tepidibacillus decaturensis]KXG43459.1 hypothetical protein U473_05110 [Tepidibacillus decaturensis]
MSKLKMITKVEQQKNNAKRFNIYLDEHYAFSVHEDILISFRLLKGKEIDEELFIKILEEEEKNKIRQKALKYLSYRHRTEKQVKQHLLEQGYEFELVLHVIRQLEEQEWINDKQYANQFVEQRIRLKPRGKKLIALELKSKGLNDEDIEESLNQIDDEKEYQLALQLAKKKVHQYLHLEWHQVQKKLAFFLQRKGFSYPIINQVLQELKDWFFGHLDNYSHE